MRDSIDLRSNGPSRSSLAQVAWLAIGLAAVAVGSIGIVVPGLPTTVFFIVAAWAFSKSSPRLEAWVLGLPRIGPMVQDHRDGLGMPRRAKRIAVIMIAVFVALSAVVIDHGLIRTATVCLGAAGIVYVSWRVPTKEQVVGQSA